MIYTVQDKVIVKVDTKYIGNFSSLVKIAALQNDTSVHLEDLVNIVGEVVSLPKNITNDRWHSGFSVKDIMPGDKCIFSFSVIYSHYQKVYMGEPIYKNLITYQGKEYWIADITNIYAVIRDEMVYMVNGYVMAEPFKEDKIFVQAKQKNRVGCKSSKVMYIGSPNENEKMIDVKQGDTVYYNHKLASKYQINNKPFIILQQKHILGKEV